MVACRLGRRAVAPGGFPRSQVQALRFALGDGTAGWGEDVTHTYEKPGVYPVVLAVRLTGHRVLRATKLAVVDPPSDFNPLFLTVDDIPAYMNGSQPVTLDSGTPDDPSDDTTQDIILQVPRDHFVIDVDLDEDPGNPVVRDSLSLTADVAMGGAQPGAELADKLHFDDGAHLDAPRARFEVGPQDAPAAGVVHLTLSARTQDGSTYERSLAVQAVEFTPELDPFDQPMTWLFRTDSDFFTTTKVDKGGGRFQLSSTATPDGKPDFVEELALLGAQGPDDALNATYLGWIRTAIKTEVYRYFGIGPDGVAHDGVEMTIAWQGEPGAPGPADFDPQGTFSMMRFGGTFDGYIGYSRYMPHNRQRVDDSTAQYGIASAGVLSALTGTPLVSTAFDPVKPGVGEPVGTNAADATVLASDFDPYAPYDEAVMQRYRDLRTVARYIALAIAPVTAHEMGHAMGLMPDGLPPEGFFGNRGDVSFVSRQRTNELHANLPGMNTMQAGGGDYLGLIHQLQNVVELPPHADVIRLAKILSLETRFSALSRAYLQRRLTYGVQNSVP